MGVKKWGRLVGGVLGFVLVGCSGGQVEGVAHGVGVVPGQGELAAALLRVEDLPSGYAVTPSATAGHGGSGGGGSEACVDVLGQLRGGAPALSRGAVGSAGVEFDKGDNGPFLQQALLSSGDRAALDGAVAAFRQLPALCDGFTETDERGSFTVRLAAADNLPVLGDDSVALKLDANGRSIDLDVTIGGYMILFRNDSTVGILIHFGIPEVDVGETEKIARAAVARLG